MRVYEAMVIIDPGLDEPSRKEAVEKFTSLISQKGEQISLEDWGKRRLAYEIGRLNEGHYLVAHFKGEPDLVSELDRMLKLGEEYVRAKIVRVPDTGAAGPAEGGSDVQHRDAGGQPDQGS